jgi:hypothetical protein
MKKLVAVMLVFTALFSAHSWAAGPSQADKAFAQRYELAHAIYGPYLEQIKYEQVLAQYNADLKREGKPGGKMSKVQFMAGKLALYQAMADVYTTEDLLLQKQLSRLTVGKRILGNIPLAMNGLQPQPVGQDQFSESDWQAYIQLLKDNKDQFIAMNERGHQLPAALDKHLKSWEKMTGTK